MDLDDLEHNTRDGLHIASLAGAWIGAVAGFGGMRDHRGTMTFAPRLAPKLERVCFRLRFRGRRVQVEVTPSEAHYELQGGDDLEIAHHGETLTLSKNDPVTRPIPPATERAAPTQPPGREPRM